MSCTPALTFHLCVLAVCCGAGRTALRATPPMVLLKESSIARARCMQRAPIPVTAGAPGFLAQVLQGGAHYLLHLALRAQQRAPQSDAGRFMLSALCAPNVSFLSTSWVRSRETSLAALTGTLWMSMHGRKPAAACTAGLCCGRASTSGAAGPTPSTTRGARTLKGMPCLYWPLHHCPPNNIDIINLSSSTRYHQDTKGSARRSKPYSADSHRCKLPQDLAVQETTLGHCKAMHMMSGASALQAEEEHSF